MNMPPITTGSNTVKIDTYVELMDRCLDQAEDVCHRRWNFSAPPEVVARIGAALFEAAVREVQLLRAILTDPVTEDTPH